MSLAQAWYQAGGRVGPNGYVVEITSGVTILKKQAFDAVCRLFEARGTKQAFVEEDSGMRIRVRPMPTDHEATTRWRFTG